MLVQSSPLLMLDTAEYFEQRRELDKAVLLYQKAGKERRALELCFSANLLDMLASIASNLTAKSDPAVMARCGILDIFACRPDREGKVGGWQGPGQGMCVCWRLCGFTLLAKAGCRGVLQRWQACISHMSFGAMQKLDLVSRLQDPTAASQILNQYMLSLGSLVHCIC